VTFYLGTTKVGTVTASVPAQAAGSYALTARVDEANAIVEQNEGNNTGNGDTLVVAPIPSADLVATTSWWPGKPSAGNAVTVTTVVKNQGNQASSATAHPVTVTIKDANGTAVKTLTGSATGAIAAGATASVTDGTWTAVDGPCTVTTVVGADPAEDPVTDTTFTNTSVTGAHQSGDDYNARSVHHHRELASRSGGTSGEVSAVRD